MDKIIIGQELRRTNKAVRAYIDQYVSTHLDEGLSGIEGMTMGFIFHHLDQDLFAQDIMKDSKVNKATMSATLKRLENKGFIRQAPYKKDKRKKVVLLTSKGGKVANEFKIIFANIEKNLEIGISPSDIEITEKVLSQIMFNAGGTAK